MVTRLTYKGIIDTIGNSPLVELQRMSPKEGVRIFAKLEGQNPTGSVKDRIALKMIDQAERNGEISANRTILEPTSGTSYLRPTGQRLSHQTAPEEPTGPSKSLRT